MNSTSSLWELAAKTSQLGYWCWDIQSNEIDWSDNIEEVLSCSRDDFADTFERYGAMIYFADRDRVLQTIQESRHNRTDHQIDYRIVLPSGERRWIEMGLRPLTLSESGEAMQLLGTVRDITANPAPTPSPSPNTRGGERKDSPPSVLGEGLGVGAGRHARGGGRERLFQLVMDNIPAFIFWKDRDLVYQGCNQNFAEVAGFGSPEELIGKTDYDSAWKKEEADFFREIDRRVMESGQAELNIIEPQLQASGKQAWLATNKIPLHDERGQVIGILGMYTDITERIEAEEAQRQASKENALLAATVANAPVGVSITDPTKKDDPIVFVNPAFLSMTGYREEDFIGRNCRFLQGAETDPQTIVQIRRALTEKEAITVEILNYRKDGTTFWNLLTIRPLFDESGKHTHFIGMQTDITARKKSEELTRRAKEAAEAANQAKSDFLANMSHELRTPLNGVLGYAQILRRDPHLTARQKQAVETIYQSGSHLSSLVDHILNFSSLDAGQAELHLTHFHLATLLHDLVNAARVKAEQKNISFIYQKDHRLACAIRGDKRYLHQILSNLLDNAIKFTKNGQVLLKITIFESDKSTEQIRLRFEVIDTGVGIRHELLAKVFQPFEQLGTLIERADGTGLGLTITRQLVQLMGGEIKVESRVGEGSRFWFDLTFQIAQESQIHSELDHPKQIANKTNQALSPEPPHAEHLVAVPLIPPPQAELETLYELANLGRMSAIRKRLTHIEQLDATYAPFANQVRELARGFEDDQIVALVEDYLAK